MTRSVYGDWLQRHRHAPSLPPGSREGNAILACAVGLDLPEVAPFVRSLRAVFSGQVILLVDRRPMLPAWLSTHGIETVLATDRLLRWKPRAIVSRFAAFAEILQERSEIRRVVLTDVREVVFQSDPFEQALKDLHFYTDDADASPNGKGDARFGGTLSGERLALELDGKSRIALGVVAGPSAEVIRFCRALLLLCNTAAGTTASDTARSAVDMVAHLGLAGGEVRPEFERVAIVSAAMSIANGRIRNPAGSMSPIIFGYRRRPDLFDHVKQTWGLTSVGDPGETSVVRALRSLQGLLGG